jgi:hypothetical protein
MTEGISKEMWDETPDAKGPVPVPVGAGREFEITEVRDPKWNEAGDQYFAQAVCTYFDEEGEAYTHWEYLALEPPKRRAWTKKFLLDIGRGDFILAGADADWQSLVGTTFQADVIHKLVRGDVRSNLKNIVNVSHDVTSLEEPPPPAPATKAAPAGKAAPGRPARGRTPR